MIFSSIAHLMACVIPVANYGSDKQKSEFLNKMAKGEWIGANAITEQNSGSDVFKMECTAEKVKEGYKINGSKIYITNAPVSDVILLFALTDKVKGFFGGISCFVFNSGKKGIKISKAKDKMGLRTAQMGEIEFKNLLVPESSMIGKPGAGGQIFNSSMIWERVVVSAFLTGQLERVLTKSIAYFKSKNSGEKKLIDIQYVQHKVAEFKTILQASKNMVYDAAVAIDQKNKNAFTKASMTKLFVSENVVNAIRELQEIHGAYGYLTENGLEREYRDATAALIYSGTSAIQKNIISSGILR
jgi:alkylation response protein AidB-like acyl-CoA dehydrogenase